MRRLNALHRPGPMTPPQRLTLLFALEGLLMQFATSVNGFGNNLYGTYLGASDQQIGMIQLVPNLTAAILLLPLGLAGERASSSRRVPAALCLFMCLSYVGMGTVPAMGPGRIGFFFLFLGLTAGMLAVYNAQWQALFSDAVPAAEQGSVYGVRIRCMNLLGTLLPLGMGALLAGLALTEQKLWLLRLFYYGAALLFGCQFFVLNRLPMEQRADKPARLGLRQIRETVAVMAKDRPFRSFFWAIMVFYLGWHWDWSMWYIGQSQYCHMNEFHLSLTSALGCVAVVSTIGIWVKKRRTHPPERLFVWGAFAMAISPLAIIFGSLVPPVWGPWVFLTLCLTGCCLQSGNTLMIMQMLMARLPRKNRMVILSLYTLVVALSNGLVPVLGVEVYTALGADHRALLLYNGLLLLLRLSAATLFLARWRRRSRLVDTASGKPENRLQMAQAGRRKA